MSLKNYLLLFAGAMAAQFFYSCGEYTDPISDLANEEYTKKFISDYGLIDPNQDWNLAEKTTVSVNVGDHAGLVKVYAKIDGKYYIMARYTDVSGVANINFCVPPGTTDLRVNVDGRKYDTKVGLTVDATGAGSRSVATTTEPGELVQVSVAANPLYFNTAQIAPILKTWVKNNGAYNPDDKWNSYLNGQYEIRTNDFGDNDPRAYGLIPEGNTQNYANTSIVKDFWITGVGDDGITIYPMFWNTNVTYHEIGIFYFEKDGDYVAPGTEGATIRTVEVFKDKNYNEEGVDRQLVLNSTLISREYSDGMEIYTLNGDCLWVNNSTDANNILATVFPDLNGDYSSLISDSRRYVYNTTNRMFTFEAEAALNRALLLDNASGTFTFNGTKQLSDYVYVIAIAENSQIQLVFLNKNYNTAPQDNPAYTLDVIQQARSLGVNIKVPSDLEFGFYLRRTTGSDGNFYSISEYNNATYNPETASFWNNNTAVQNQSFAATFLHPASGNQFFSFEDAAQETSEWDLNDLVFRIAGTFTTKTKDSKTTATFAQKDKPNPNPGDGNNSDETDTPYTWTLGIEDMGSIGDFDFNDLVVGISVVEENNPADHQDLLLLPKDNGRADTWSMVTFKALAGGGTLPAKLYFRGSQLVADGTDDGEWHKWFGASATTIVNTYNSKSKVAGKSVTYLIQDFDLSGFLSKSTTHNSGFKVSIKNNDAKMVEIAPNGKGNAPQMILVPGNWKWPTEQTRIDDAYPDFKKWVNDAQGGQNWYNNPKAAKYYDK